MLQSEANLCKFANLQSLKSVMMNRWWTCFAKVKLLNKCWSTLTEIYSYLGFVCFLLCCVSPSNGTAGKISHLLKDKWSEQRQEPFIKTESLKVKFRMACLSCPFICSCEQLQNVLMVPSEMSRKHQKAGFWAWKGADLKVLGLSTFNLGMEVTCVWKSQSFRKPFPSGSKHTVCSPQPWPHWRCCLTTGRSEYPQRSLMSLRDNIDLVSSISLSRGEIGIPYENNICSTLLRFLSFMHATNNIVPPLGNDDILIETRALCAQGHRQHLPRCSHTHTNLWSWCSEWLKCRASESVTWVLLYILNQDSGGSDWVLTGLQKSPSITLRNDSAEGHSDLSIYGWC